MYINKDGFGSIHLSDEIRKDWSHPLQIMQAPAELLRAVYSPLAHTLKQVEIHVIRPYLSPLIKPLAQIAPKITIAGHRYDLGGHELLEKAVAGAVGGFLTKGGPYGAVLGAIAGMLVKGKPDVAASMGAGLIAGAGAKVMAYYTPIAGTGGMTAADMLRAGATQDMVNQISLAAAAPGGLANAANASLMPDVGTVVNSTTGNVIAQGTAGGFTSVTGEVVGDQSISQPLNLSQEIPGTGGMTGQDMLNAGADPGQVNQISNAANAPGGLANPANASLMPDVGNSASNMLQQAAQTGNPLTVDDIAKGLKYASGITGIAQKFGLLGKKHVPAATLPDGTIIPAHVEEESLINSPYIWLIGGAVVFAGVVIYKKTR